VPHARIVSIDTFDAEQLPRVVAVATSKDIRGLNAFGILLPNQPAMCSDKVRHIGDAVAAIVDEPGAHSKPIRPRSTMAATFGTTRALSAPTLSALQRPASLS
jgi:xanthine dehydrogenase molybdopterin-binding subunit B